jgi:hypothetical protein
MAKIYVDNVGGVILLDTKTDISAATSIVIKVKKPDNSKAEWAAAVYNTTFVKYTTIADDLNMPGDYKVQAHFTLNGWTGRGETAKFEVHSHFH